MRSKKLLDDAYKEKTAKEAKEKVEKEVEIYEKLPMPNKEDTFKNMFEEMPFQLKEQYEEFMKNG